MRRNVDFVELDVRMLRNGRMDLDECVVIVDERCHFVAVLRQQRMSIGSMLGRAANLRRNGSGRHKSCWLLLQIAGEEVVLVHLRTLSLSRCLMSGWKVIETLSDESDSISEAIRETGQIVGPTLALWSSRRHPFQKLYYCGLSDLMKSDICDVQLSS